MPPPRRVPRLRGEHDRVRRWRDDRAHRQRDERAWRGRCRGRDCADGGCARRSCRCSRGRGCCPRRAPAGAYGAEPAEEEEGEGLVLSCLPSTCVFLAPLPTRCLPDTALCLAAYTSLLRITTTPPEKDEHRESASIEDHVPPVPVPAVAAPAVPPPVAQPERGRFGFLRFGRQGAPQADLERGPAPAPLTV